MSVLFNLSLNSQAEFLCFVLILFCFPYYYFYRRGYGNIPTSLLRKLILQVQFLEENNRSV